MSIIKRIYRKLITTGPIWWIRMAGFRRNPKGRADSKYHAIFGRHIDWENPREFNEKIRWMQFYGDTGLWPRLADKYSVRRYLEEQGYGDILVPLYGVWESADEVDFDSLPESFIIKTTHGCEGVFAVPDKSKEDLPLLRRRLAKSISTEFGVESAEPHYLAIKPRIIAEALLPNDSGFSSSVVDYKLYCFDGEPEIIGVFYDRPPRSHQMACTFYDKDWIRHDEWRSPAVTLPSKDVPRPKTLDRMIEAARTLCAPFPFVRFDLYEAGGKLYFGEFTFTPGQASGGSLHPSLFEVLGEKFHHR